MAAVVACRYDPVIRAFYESLMATGKLKSVALVACMRKLLVILNVVTHPRMISPKRGLSEFRFQDSWCRPIPTRRRMTTA